MKLALALAASAALLPAAALAQPMPAAHPGPGFEMRGAHPGAVMRHAPGRFRHFRINRGGFIPPFFFGPQFHVRSWAFHGFPAPFAGGRWVRFHDDALLIDRDGRVHDARYGWDWSRERDRWRDGPEGVPVYVGDGDYEPDDWDYEWAERWERGERDDHAYGHGDDDRGGRCADRCGPPPGPMYGGYGHGWAWMPVMITETITTTTTSYGGSETKTRTYHKKSPHRAKPRKPVHRAPPPPPPGERG